MEGDTDDNKANHDLTQHSTSIFPRSATHPASMGRSEHDGSSTPLLNFADNQLLKQQHVLRVCDSGFSEWSPTSDCGDISGATPSLLPTSSSSTACTADFTTDPVFSSMPSEISPRHHRRSWPLKSRRLSFLSPDLSSSQDTNCENVENTNTFNTSEEEIHRIMLLKSELSNKPRHDLLCQVLHRSRSSSRSPLSSASDELENSFQEMSLEENSSSESAQHSPLTANSSSPVFSFVHHFKFNERSSANSFHRPSQKVIKTLCSQISKDDSVISSTNALSSQIQHPVDDGHSATHVDQTNFAASLSLRPVHQLESTPQESSSLSSTACHSCSKVVETDGALSSSHCSKESHSSLVIHEDDVKPSKRSSDIIPDNTCCDSVSPTKVRRLKNRSKFIEKGDPLRRDLFGESKSVDNLLPDLDKDCTVKINSRSADERVPQFLNLDNALGVSPQKNKVVCVTDDTENDTSLQDKCEHSESLVEKVCRMYLPSNPSQLIGRHVGVKQFDIIGGLYQRNLIGCVELILENIPDCCLVKIGEVSTEWKSALHEETKAFKRCKTLLRKANSPRKARSNAEKENVVDDKLHQKTNVLMTASKGHLTSIQPQLVPKAETGGPASATPHVDLQFEDRARNCPHCQSQAVILPSQDRATCVSEKCEYDFCTKCFFPFHYSTPCKPLFNCASKTTLAGTKKSKKNLKRLKNS